MLISANMGFKVHIKLRLMFTSEFVTFWDVARTGGGPRRMNTKCDIEGEG